MKQQEAEVLTNAGTIEHAVIMRSAEKWAIHLYGKEYRSVARDCDAVEVARGHRVVREWTTLDSAHKWIRSLPKGTAIKVEIDG